MAAAWCKNKRIRIGIARGITRSAQHISIRYVGNRKGFPIMLPLWPQQPVKVVIVKWPRARGHPRSIITREQVAIWDLFLAIISQLDPVLYNLCLEKAECSMKYARDIVIACGYGNYISYPGHGKHPDGPTSP